MAQGDKDKYTEKQKRMAEHIKSTYKDKGYSDSKAEEIAWKTVNDKEGGGNNPGGSGRS